MTFLNKIALNYVKECRNHSEFITNRKLWFFWFETVLQVFFNSEIFFFWDRLKKIKNKKWHFLKIFRKLKKVEIFNEKHIWFSLKISTFSNFRIFFKKDHFLCFIFFNRSQTKYFSELKKKSEYSFESKKSYLSIGDVIRVIAAVLHRV